MADQAEKEQKTEEATPKKRDEAREKGQVAMSTEFIAAIGLAVGLASLMLGGGALMRAIGENAVDVVTVMGEIGTSDLTVPEAAVILEESTFSATGLLLAVTLPPILISALAGFLQVGFRIAPKALELDFNKVNPVSGWSKFLSMRSAVRTGMAATKVVLITVVVVWIALLHLEQLTRVGINELGPMLAAVGVVLFRCCLGALAVVIALAIADLLYQRYQHSVDLRMTKKEVRDEAKMTEGDPHVRARIRRMQSELASRRMMADVPKATVVVTNPTHYAVALRYERDADDAATPRAPVVLAKGIDSLAQRIKAVAREHGVVCYEDVPLARALHAQCEVGDEIPEDLYAAVAAVLGYVYRMRGRVPEMAASA